MCRIGKAELKEEVSKYLQEWGWERSVEELLNFWFSSENVINEQVLNVIGRLRLERIKCYLASDHSRYRADDLLDNVGLRNYFDGAFFSAYLGRTKGEPEFYEKVTRELELKPEEVVFFDDKQGNVDVACKFGIKAYLYDGFEGFEETVKKLFNLSA